MLVLLLLLLDNLEQLLAGTGGWHVAHKVAPEFAEKNEYLAKYGEKTDWGIGYGWMLVLGMLVGGTPTLHYDAT